MVRSKQKTSARHRGSVHQRITSKRALLKMRGCYLASRRLLAHAVSWQDAIIAGSLSGRSF